MSEPLSSEQRVGLHDRLEEIRVKSIDLVAGGFAYGGFGQAIISLELSELEEEATSIREQLGVDDAITDGHGLD